MRPKLAALLSFAALPLGGCVYAAAAGAVGSAVTKGSSGGARVLPDPAAAREACTARAAAEGSEVRIIDAVARGESVRVFGTVAVGSARRSFRCDHRGGRVTDFSLGGIARAG
jgi:hypothetical protein